MWKRLVVIVGLGVAMLAPNRAMAQIPDSTLADRVAARVRDYAQFSIFDDVNISVSNRCVTLTGRVTQPFKRDEIGARVAKLDGVQSLVNDIQVLPLSALDSDLRVRVAQAIYGHPSFWHYAAMARPPIHIIVEGGRVTLTGRVTSEVERTLAFALAQVPGTFGVKNDIRLGST